MGFIPAADTTEVGLLASSIALGDINEATEAARLGTAGAGPPPSAEATDDTTEGGLFSPVAGLLIRATGGDAEAEMGLLPPKVGDSATGDAWLALIPLADTTEPGLLITSTGTSIASGTG